MKTGMRKHKMILKLTQSSLLSIEYMGMSVLGGKGKMRREIQEEIKRQKGILVKCKFNFP